MWKETPADLTLKNASILPMGYWVLLFTVLFIITDVPKGAAAQSRVDSSRLAAEVKESVIWLEQEAQRLVRACRRELPNGQVVFPPQLGAGYEAFWLRDFAYMLEGVPTAFTLEEVRQAVRLFAKAQRADGACVDCVAFDGRPIYQPGFGTMGENPVADGSQFYIDIVYHAYHKLEDKQILEELWSSLERAFRALPRHPKTGLVWIDTERAWDRCPYGFTDTVRKQGAELFSSLLLVQTLRQMSELASVRGKPALTAEYAAQAAEVSAQIREVFWDARQGLFLAATAKCRQPDIWGSAFAVFLDVASPEQARLIANYFRHHYHGLVENGQVRHLPPGLVWEEACPPGEYQNGGFWGVPTGWFAFTLDLADSELADQTIVDLVRFYRQYGCVEWSRGQRRQLPGYVASAAAPLPAIRAMFRRRGENAHTSCDSLRLAPCQ